MIGSTAMSAVSDGARRKLLELTEWCGGSTSFADLYSLLGTSSPELADSLSVREMVRWLGQLQADGQIAWWWDDSDRGLDGDRQEITDTVLARLVEAYESWPHCVGLKTGTDLVGMHVGITTDGRAWLGRAT